MEKVFMIFCLMLLCSNITEAAQELVATKTDSPPKIDGHCNEEVWQTVPPLKTIDKITGIPIELQAVYTDEHVYISAHFPDKTENREHKTLEWDKEEGVYRTSTKREDSFVIKWSMEPVQVNLSLQSEDSYKADIWFWKAFRTDPMGFADDKYHVYGTQKNKKSKEILTSTGNSMFLARKSDSGKSAYQSIAYEKYSVDIVPRYKHREPEGSRSDIRAKGSWSNGLWSIEFKRALVTGNPDDIQFNPMLKYHFGVSRHEIAGKRPNPDLEQPYYESGDVGEPLTLSFR